MTLEEILLSGSQLVLHCEAPDCGAETELDACFFASRYRLSARIADVQSHLVCTGCGSKRIKLIAAAKANDRN